MRNKIFVTLFVLFLFLPILGNVFGISIVRDLFEKRQAASKPALPKNMSELETFPRQFDRYYNDNYGFRKFLISVNGTMMDKIFNESPDDRVLVGKDGWLYFDNKGSLLDAAGRAKLDDVLVAEGVMAFYRNWQNAKKRGLKYLLVIAADKSTIYPEFLPDYFTYNSRHRIDIFKDALLRQYPDFPIIDLRDVLLSAKKNDVLYHKTDTHWNKRGAHLAYVEMMKKLNIAPYLSNHFKKVEGQYIGDISHIMGSNQSNRDFGLEKKFTSHITIDHDAIVQLKDQFHKVMIYKHDNANLPRLFAYKDSFFGELQDLVSEHFSYAIYANEFPCRIDYDILQTYSPDYVIQQFWESRIESILNNC